MDFGITAEELSNELANVLQAVRDTGRKGTLALKLTIKPESIQTGQISITPDIASNPPQIARERSMLFMTPDNNLQREDPRQKSLEFTAVTPSKKQELTTAEQATQKEFSQAN
jgi:hypothetical protein